MRRESGRVYLHTPQGALAPHHTPCRLISSVAYREYLLLYSRRL